MTNTSNYIMDHPREAQRLLDKVDPDAWIAKFIEPHLAGVRNFLSVGCGPGVFLRELAGSHPQMGVAGVDLSASRIRDAEQRLNGLPNARACVGEATHLPFDDNSFDMVFSRFLVEYLPDKMAAVREMARVCRPGGMVMLQDLDGQLVWHFPEDPAIQQATEQVVNFLANTGFDPFVGRKLFSFCLGAKLEEVRVQVDPYHLYAGTINEEEFANWQSKLDIARPQIKTALGSDEAAQKFSERFLEYLRNPTTLTYSCLFTVTAIKTGNKCIVPRRSQSSARR
jgi:SAM-dependent methyltransferase